MNNEAPYESLYEDLRGKPKYQRGNNARRTNRRTSLRVLNLDVESTLIGKSRKK